MHERLLGRLTLRDRGLATRSNKPRMSEPVRPAGRPTDGAAVPVEGASPTRSQGAVEVWRPRPYGGVCSVGVTSFRPPRCRRAPVWTKQLLVLAAAASLAALGAVPASA